MSGKNTRLPLLNLLTRALARAKAFLFTPISLKSKLPRRRQGDCPEPQITAPEEKYPQGSDNRAGEPPRPFVSGKPVASLHPQRAGAKGDSYRSPAFLPARLFRAGSVTSVAGTATYVSRTGAFIQTNHWRNFKVNDQVAFTIFPGAGSPESASERSGQRMARVSRVEGETGGVEIQFVDNFTDSEGMAQMELAGRSRYQVLGFYLFASKSLSLPEFKSKYPFGFLLEKWHARLDKSVIFQFGTQELDKKDILCGSGHKDITVAKAIELKVLEVKKRKAETSSELISIGRSPGNDIVLYDRYVSKAHADFYVPAEEEKIYIVDAGSTNDTFLNKQKLVPKETYELKAGDEIAFGPQVELIYLTNAAFYDFLSKLLSYVSTAELAKRFYH